MEKISRCVGASADLFVCLSPAEFDALIDLPEAEKFARRRG